jgi:hypothetical protein
VNRFGTVCMSWFPTVRSRESGEADLPSDENLLNLDICVWDRDWNMRVAGPLCLYETEIICSQFPFARSYVLRYDEATHSRQLESTIRFRILVKASIEL